MSLFSNPFSMAVVVLILLGSIVYYFIRRYKAITYVELLRPRDGRGKKFEVDYETDVGLKCKKTKGLTPKFIKIGRGWLFNERGKSITKFFGIEGTAYTATIDIENEKPIKMKIEAFLRWVWGDKFYNSIPSTQRDTIEKSTWGLTIDPVKIDEEEHNLETLPMESVHDEADAIVLNAYAQNTMNNKKIGIMPYLIGGVIGSAVMYIAVTKGWF